MLRPALLALAAMAAFAAPTAAQQADIEQFVNFQAALYLDDKCGFLKQFERGHSYSVEADLKSPLHFESAFSAGKIDETEYHAELDPLIARGKAIADSIACTNQQAAATYILPLRDRLARIIYAELIIAVQSEKMNAEQNQAAHAYEAMIAPLYGQNWAGFVQYAQGQAQRKVDDSRKLDAEMNPFANDSLIGAFSFGDYNDYGNIYASTMYFDSLVNGTIVGVDSILFEVIAEQFGLRHRTLRSPSGASSILALVDSGGNRVADILQQPARYTPLEGGNPIAAVFAIQPDKTIRIMTFGADAALMQDGSVTVLINPNALEDGQAVDYDWTMTIHATRIGWMRPRCSRRSASPNLASADPVLHCLPRP